MAESINPGETLVQLYADIAIAETSRDTTEPIPEWAVIRDLANERGVEQVQQITELSETALAYIGKRSLEAYFVNSTAMAAAFQYDLRLRRAVGALVDFVKANRGAAIEVTQLDSSHGSKIQSPSGRHSAQARGRLSTASMLSPYEYLFFQGKGMWFTNTLDSSVRVLRPSSAEPQITVKFL